jgi:hypothetical protein
MPRKDEINDNNKPARVLPDVAICRARRSGVIDMAYCLVDKPHGCKYAEPFKGKIFCFHPEREEIMARTDIGRV